MDILPSLDLRDLKASDIMRTDVIMAREEMSLSELARLFYEKRVTGVPVISRSGSVIGVVSKTDLIRISASSAENPKENVPSYFRITSGENSEQSYEINLEDLKPHSQRTVAEIMTPWIIAALPETPLTEVAATMVREGVHRVLVVTADKQLKGIITSMDIVRTVSRSGRKA